jgi:hypothetical protein
MQFDSGTSTLRYDIVTTSANPGGQQTVWYNAVADVTHPRFGAGVIALLSDIPASPVTTVRTLTAGVNFTGSGTLTLTTEPPSINLIGSFSITTTTRTSAPTVSVIDYIIAPALPATFGSSAQTIVINNNGVPVSAMVYCTSTTNLRIDLMAGTLASGVSISNVSGKSQSVVFST